MRFDVSVVGLFILDVLGRPVSRIPEEGNVEFIDQIRLTVAGTAGGTVVDCAKLGMKALAVGAVGDDEKADFVLGVLQRHGIDTSLMQRLPGVPTSATILNVRPNGDRPALHQRGASDHFEIPQQFYDTIFDARFVHMGGTGLLNRLDGRPTVDFLRAAKERKVTTSFDLIAATANTIDLVKPALPYIDYFMPSVEEARIMSALEPVEDVAQFYLDLGAKVCIFTMGGNGAFVATSGMRLRVPAFDVEVIDTTGCGDAFSAGILAALSRGYDIEQAARFASTAAGLVATGLGSDAGIISFERTLESMQTLRRKPLRQGASGRVS